MPCKILVHIPSLLASARQLSVKSSERRRLIRSLVLLLFLLVFFLLALVVIRRLTLVVLESFDVLHLFLVLDGNLLLRLLNLLNKLHWLRLVLLLWRELVVPELGENVYSSVVLLLFVVLVLLVDQIKVLAQLFKGLLRTVFQAEVFLELRKD